MNMEGDRHIHATPSEVWAGLTDPEILKRCIPGCTELTGGPEEGYDAVVVQKVGPVKATFRGRVNVEEVRELAEYRLSGEGSGGVAGFAKGAANVTLSEREGGTELAYVVEARLGGKLAQLGNRIVGGFARKMADKFFENFQSQYE